MRSQPRGVTVTEQETKADDACATESDEEQNAEKTLDDIIDAYTS